MKEVEDHFRLLPATTDEFNHFRPAAYLLEHRGEFVDATGIDVALDRFEALFTQLNAFLD